MVRDIPKKKLINLEIPKNPQYFQDAAGI